VLCLVFVIRFSHLLDAGAPGYLFVQAALPIAADTSSVPNARRRMSG